MSHEFMGGVYDGDSKRQELASDATIRDYFAGLALQGMITTSGAPALAGFSGAEGYMARAAYRMADEMLKYRRE